MWVASNGGLHRLTQQGAWVENGIEEGLPGMSVRALFEDPRGRLWAGTSHGLSLYDPTPTATRLSQRSILCRRRKKTFAKAERSR